MSDSTGEIAPRLSAGALARLHDGVEPPSYRRDAAQTIVHLGWGAFARAHLGTYIDDLAAAGHPSMIRGVSLRSHRAEGQLSAQDGLYSVLEREPDLPPRIRVVGSLGSIATGTEAAVEAVASSDTQLVTLTVTEKAYTASPEDESSVARVIAEGVDRRVGTAPRLVVASLDNLAFNGLVLREAVLRAASLIHPDLADRIASDVRFPCSVVDRMVPATTAADVAEAERLLGAVDLGVVVAERYRSWVVTRTEGLPPLGDVGVEMVDDIEPYQRRKLWLLNGPHSALAYAGLVVGCDTIAAAATHPVIAPFVERLVDDVLAVATFPPHVDAVQFAEVTLRRFRNPDLGHTCVQVGGDGSKKLPQRILPVVELAERDRHPTERFATVVACWIAAVAGLEAGAVELRTPEDPISGELRELATSRDLAAVVDRALDGQASRAFAELVERTIRSLSSDGSEALARHASSP